MCGSFWLFPREVIWRLSCGNWTVGGFFSWFCPPGWFYLSPGLNRFVRCTQLLLGSNQFTSDWSRISSHTLWLRLYLCIDIVATNCCCPIFLSSLCRGLCIDQLWPLVTSLLLLKPFHRPSGGEPLASNKLNVFNVMTLSSLSLFSLSLSRLLAAGQVFTPPAPKLVSSPAGCILDVCLLFCRHGVVLWMVLDCVVAFSVGIKLCVFKSAACGLFNHQYIVTLRDYWVNWELFCFRKLRPRFPPVCFLLFIQFIFLQMKIKKTFCVWNYRIDVC